jgi:U2 small nuclear ribonucleoprotein A'
MRITPNLIATAITTGRPTTLSLRDLDIPLVENLEQLPDIYETIDLTNNEIVTMGNFPLLMKTRTLLLAKNRVNNIQEGIQLQLPKLKSLSLVGNSISDYSTLEKLKHLKRLEDLYMNDNPICLMEHLREFTIWCLPNLKVLNFEKVSMKERQRARELFGDVDEPTELVYKLRTIGKKHTGSNDDIGSVVKKLSEEEREKLKQELKSATSLKDIDRIETALRNGYL